MGKEERSVVVDRHRITYFAIAVPSIFCATIVGAVMWNCRTDSKLGCRYNGFVVVLEAWGNGGPVQTRVRRRADSRLLTP